MVQLDTQDANYRWATEHLYCFDGSASLPKSEKGVKR